MSGGWFDAGGGYEKFAYTASYADGLLEIAERDFPGRYPTLRPEASFGLSWLEKLWNPAKKVLYIQVGIGNGNASNTIQGDYNFWFLPQAEDRMDVKGGNPGPTAYYVKYRPVFEAAPPGQPISPDFAGRFAADFGLAAQLAARTDPASAEHLLALARGIYAMAKTTDVGQIVTTYPYDYYPGTEWKSDMLWGAAEIALADEALAPRPGRCTRDLQVAAAGRRPTSRRAIRRAATRSTCTTTARSARASCCAPCGRRACAGAGHRRRARCWPTWPRSCGWGRAGPRATRSSSAPSWARATPRRTPSACTSPTRCTSSTAAGTAYQAFAQQQLNFALGANGWGTTFVVGAGTTFPHCMQSEIANLAGSLTGTGDIQLGAVRRAEQPGQLRRARHRQRHAGVQRGQLQPVQHQDRQVRGQRGLLAVG